MKKIIVLAFVAISAVLFAQQQQSGAARTMPRSEWLAKVGECALDPEALKATIAQLSPEDKTAFLAEVNAAIMRMPGSSEVKAAQFLTANRAAIAGAGPEDRGAVLAEVFATVPTEALTVINEEFAQNEFARPATMSDGQFVAVMSAAMSKISERCASSESGAVRTGFAGLMFVRAAGTAQAAAVDVAVEALPPAVREEAAQNWFPNALGSSQQAADGTAVSSAPSYDSMLASAQAGEEPDHALTVSIVSQQITDSMLADLQTRTGLPADDSGDVDRAGVQTTSVVPHERVLNSAIPLVLETGNPADVGKPAPNEWYSSGKGGAADKEPDTYWLQNL